MPALTYFITGGNRGIGFEIAKNLSAVKSNKIIVSVRDAEKATALKELASKTGNITLVTLDVSSPDSIGAFNEQLTKVAPEGIDFFISNAGVSLDCVPLLEVPPQDLRKVLATNTFGPILLTRLVVQHMEKKPTKKIIFVSSAVGSLTNFANISANVYGVSKAALNYIAKELAFELGPKGYIVISLHPGAVKTDMGKSSIEFFRKQDSHKDFDFDAIFISPEESGKSIYENIILKTTAEDNGKFLNQNGEEIPW